MSYTMSCRTEDRAERMFHVYMGTLRVRYMSTENLLVMYRGWEGEDRIKNIPVVLIRAELEYRGQCIACEWNSDCKCCR